MLTGENDDAGDANRKCRLSHRNGGINRGGRVYLSVECGFRRAVIIGVGGHGTGRVKMKSETFLNNVHIIFIPHTHGTL